MSLVLEGTLVDIRLGDLLRLIAREQRSGELRVTVDGVPHRFGLCDGHVMSATVGEGGEAVDLQSTLLSLIRHRRGEFRLAPGEDDSTRGADGGIHAEQLAGVGDMELLVLTDRLEVAGGEASRPQRDAFPRPHQMESLDSDTRRVYGLVDGDHSLEEIVLRSQRDPARVMDALDHLVAENLVKLESPEEESRPAADPDVASRALRLGGDAIAAALPLVLLLAWLAFSGPLVAPEGEPFEIRRDPLAAARAAYDVEQLRAAVKAHRFAEGHWPERLGALATRGYVSEAALTDARGRPYYYATREDGFVLLAPER